MSSLIPEREGAAPTSAHPPPPPPPPLHPPHPPPLSFPNQPIRDPLSVIPGRHYGNYPPGTPPVQDRPEDRERAQEYSKFQATESPSPKLDSSSAGLSETDLSKYFGHSDQLTSDSSFYQGGSQLPYKDVNSLSAQPSGTQSSQSYGPSYHMDKLSMQVGCHTQLTPGGEFPVVSLLEQLEGRRGKGESGGLHPSELKQLDVDEIGLLKQRMKLLFYEQKMKKEKEASAQLGGGKHPGVPEHRPTWKTEMAELAEEGKGIEEEGEKEEKQVVETVVDPDKFLQLTKLRNDLESLRKLISDQKKRCREIHFAREREEQSLRQAEGKFRTQNSRQFVAFMRPEDEARWQRDQRRRLKEWERIQLEKSRRLQQIDIEEHHARSKQKAYEQHYSEVKKQLQALEASVSPSLGRPRVPNGGKHHAHGLGVPRLQNELPEKDWMGSAQPLRALSTDNVNTSSWFSADNLNVGKGVPDSYGSESIATMGDVSSASNLLLSPPPIGRHSDASSPTTPVEHVPYWIPPHAQSHSEIPMSLARGEKLHQEALNRQEGRLRALREERQHQLMTAGSIPVRSAEEKTAQLYQLKMEVQRAREHAEMAHMALPPPLELRKDMSDQFHDQFRPAVPQTQSPDGYYGYRRESEPLHDASLTESSLSSATPDVVPTGFEAPSIHARQAIQQSHSPPGLHKSLSSILPTRSDLAEMESSRSSSNLHQPAYVHHTKLLPPHIFQSSHHLHQRPQGSPPPPPPPPSQARQGSHDVLQADSSTHFPLSSKDRAGEFMAQDGQLPPVYNASHLLYPPGVGYPDQDQSFLLPPYKKTGKHVGSTAPQRYSRGRPEPSNPDDKAKTRFQSHTNVAGRQYQRQQTEL